MSASREVIRFYETIYNEEKQEVFFKALEKSSPALDFETICKTYLPEEFDEQARLVDLGCGNGDQTCLLASFFPGEIIGVDAVEKSLDIGRELAKEGDVASRVCFQQGDLSEALPFENESVDVVFSYDVFSYFEDINRLLAECHRILKPGGILLCLTAFESKWMGEKDFRMIEKTGCSREAMQLKNFQSAVLAKPWDILEEKNLYGQMLEDQEIESQDLSISLLGLMRLQRDREEVVKEVGEEDASILEALFRYNAMVAMGKIEYHLFLLKRK